MTVANCAAGIHSQTPRGWLRRHAMIPYLSYERRFFTMIPTNIITGFLGVGKTTAILDLLRRRSSNERWGVLVNEFGDVAIDQISLAGQHNGNTVVREVAGGCICCTAGISMQDAVCRLVESADISRLVIEPTGLGHPWRVLDSLRNERFQEVLDLRATICLVDPRDHRKVIAQNNRTFLDQAHLADVIVLNKTDLADDETVAECRHWAGSLFPAKSLVATTQQGCLDSKWLDMVSDPMRTPLFADLHAHHDSAEHRHPAVQANNHASHVLIRGKPYRAVNTAGDHHACGWIFSPEDVFDEDRLLEALLDRFDVMRLKGAFRVGDEWILINRVQTETKVQVIAYRRDSRVEAIAVGPRDWCECEKALISCLK
jgi:G3E family GTPase